MTRSSSATARRHASPCRWRQLPASTSLPMPRRPAPRHPAVLDAAREHALERLACDVRREPRDLGLAGLVGAVEHLRGRRDAEGGLEQAVDRERGPRDADREVEVDVGEDRGHERRLVRPRPARVDQQHGLARVALEQVEEAGGPRVRRRGCRGRRRPSGCARERRSLRRPRACARAGGRARAWRACASRGTRPRASARMPPRASAALGLRDVEPRAVRDHRLERDRALAHRASPGARRAASSSSS